jgi:phenylacetate-CoA ligase
MSMAVECDRHEGLHVNSENILLETERPGPEGPSEFLVTDLHNYGMPFIRYRIGDVGLLDFTGCSCNRGLPKIQSIVGRTLDVLRGKDGRIIPGEFFPHLLKDIVEVSEFQVEQKSLEHIVLSVVLTRPMSAESEALLQDELRKVFGDNANVEIRTVNSIPLRASGKRRVTVGLGL